jgi:hypothetical protein
MVREPRLRLSSDVPSVVSDLVYHIVDGCGFFFAEADMEIENEDKPAVNEGKLHQANRTFTINHSMSIHLNAISLVATIWYAFWLSSSLLPEV